MVSTAICTQNAWKRRVYGLSVLALLLGLAENTQSEFKAWRKLSLLQTRELQAKQARELQEKQEAFSKQSTLRTAHTQKTSEEWYASLLKKTEEEKRPIPKTSHEQILQTIQHYRKQSPRKKPASMFQIQTLQEFEDWKHTIHKKNQKKNANHNSYPE